MAWVERIDRRTRTGKTFQDSADPRRFALDTTLAPLHFESAVDSGQYDTPIDATPVRVNVASFDGWRIAQNGWHYALGKDLANHGSEDGWVGFGGRQGQHWFKFRLARVGYLHWPTRVWTDIGGAPNYARANLTSETRDIEFATDDSTQPIESVAVWNSLWTTPGGGSLDVSWRVNGDQLKEEIVINQAGRDWLTANRPPATPLSETWFGFVFRLDWSDVPRVVRRGILQDTAGDFADDGEPVELRDALDRLLAFMPVDDLIVRADEEEIERTPLRKRFYRDGDGNNYLLVGVRCDVVAGLAAGDLVFDPTIDAQVGAGRDDGARYTGTSGFNYTTTSNQLGYIANFNYFNLQGFMRWGGITIAGTIGTSYIQLYAPSAASGTPELKVYGVDEDNPAAPTSAAEFDADPLTTAGVDWDGAWTASTFNQSPNLSAIFQELVDTYTISDDAVMVQVKNDGGATQRYNSWTTYEGSSANAPKLHIEYTEGGGGGTTYEDALTLAREHGLTGAAAGVLAGALGLGRTAGFASGGAGVFASAVSLGCTLAIAGSGGLDLAGALALGKTLGIAPNAAAVMAAALALGRTADAASSAGLDASASLNLGKSLGLSESAAAVLVAALALGKTVTVTPGGNLIVGTGLTLGRAGGMTSGDAASLGAAASLDKALAITTNGGLSISDSVTLGKVLAAALGVLITKEGGLTLARTAALDAASQLEAAANLTLARALDLSPSSLVEYQVSVNLGRGHGLTVTGAGPLYAAFSLARALGAALGAEVTAVSRPGSVSISVTLRGSVAVADALRGRAATEDSPRGGVEIGDSDNG